MILTKEQSEKRLNSDKNIININFETLEPTSVVEFKKIGINNPNGNRGKTLTEDERIAIGVLASVAGDETAADIFGIHRSHANDIKNGNRNVGNGESGSSKRVQDETLTVAIKERLDRARLTVEERAAEVLLSSLGLITPDKMENSSAKELSQITNQMSQVVRNMRGPSGKDEDKKTPVKVVIMQPKTSQESSFDVIEIGVG